MPVTVDGIDVVIVAEDDGNLLGEAESYWTPAYADVPAAEEAIAAEQGTLEHKRQYVGFGEGGERKILFNGFCDAFGLDWHAGPALVEDGGRCTFEAECNVDTGELERFRFNREA